MATVHRAFGFRFVIFANDHTPPHIHLVGQGGEAKVVLDGEESGGVRLDWSTGIGAGDMRRLLQEVEQRKSLFLDEWRRIHG